MKASGALPRSASARPRGWPLTLPRGLPRAGAAFLLSVALQAFLPQPAQAQYIPPNPISPPAPVTLTPLEPPVVTAPTLAGDTAARGDTSGRGETAGKGETAASGAGRSDAGQAASGAPGTTAGTAAGTLSANALSLLGLGNSSPLAKALSGASDDEDSLDALSSLLGGSAAQASALAGSPSSDSATLAKILALLEKQQAAAGGSGAAGAGPSGNASGTAGAGQAGRAESVRPSAVSGAELLRFAVNGYNLLPTVRTLVSSILAKDGSFLVTGDRRYLSGKDWRTETFYLLCRSDGAGRYRLFADVSQDKLNAYSYAYALAGRSPLAGTLTGDILVFRTTDADFSIDVVFRIAGPSVQRDTGR